MFHGGRHTTIFSIILYLFLITARDGASWCQLIYYFSGEKGVVTGGEGECWGNHVKDIPKCGAGLEDMEQWAITFFMKLCFKVWMGAYDE